MHGLRRPSIDHPITDGAKQCETEPNFLLLLHVLYSHPASQPASQLAVPEDEVAEKHPRDVADQEGRPRDTYRYALDSVDPRS